jgi:hypothetical protein
MEQLGNSPALRARMAPAARARAMEFDWPRYHDAVAAAVEALGSGPEGSRERREAGRAFQPDVMAVSGWKA